MVCSQKLHVIPKIILLALALFMASCGDNLVKGISIKAKALASSKPVITSIYYPGGSISGGTRVTIKGEEFVDGIKIFLGDAHCKNLVIISPEELECTTGRHEEAVVDVIAVSWDGQEVVLEKAYTYRAGPKVQKLEPAYGSARGGTYVTIIGDNFLPKAQVDFGGSPCKKVQVVSTTEIVCFTGLHAADSVNIKVTNHDSQTGSLNGGYSYRSEPTTGRIFMAGGFSQTGDDLMVLRGSDFLSGKSLMDIFYQEWMIE